MAKNRLEAFSDGVIAIIITIMVLELKPPHGASLETLRELWPVFLSYILSFINVGIYWNNHHHMLHAVHKVEGKALWANLNLLFWLSLMPFATAWMGENHFAPMPVAAYGVVLLMSALSYTLLSFILIRENQNSLLAHAIGADFKGKISIVLYTVALPLAFIYHWASLACYVTVAAIWFLPDRRIERQAEYCLPPDHEHPHPHAPK